MPDWRNTMNEVVVNAAARTAIGDFGGALKDVPPIDLRAAVIKEALARAGVAGAEVGHVAVGHGIDTEPSDMYLDRNSVVYGKSVSLRENLGGRRIIRKLM